VEFNENIEIQQKWANSTARLKIPHSAENRDRYFPPPFQAQSLLFAQYHTELQ